MKIGKNWLIESDSLNVTLKQRIRVKATDKAPAHYSWRVMGYYSTVQSALRALVDAGIADTELKDIKTVTGKIDKLYKLIEGIK